jgi:regulator of protease activity HflC (stomatin/prohibitin superfamily)
MGTILFLLFLCAAGLGVYVFFRRRQIPIGHIGVVTFLGTRTNRVFAEGLYVLPPFCTVIDESVMDAKLELAIEDTAANDGVSIVFKAPFLRYRLKQLPKAHGATSRFRFPLLQRFVPIRMDDTLAEYLNIRSVLDDNLWASAQGAISTFVATVPHARVLGYDVIGIVNALLAGATFEATRASTDDVRETRRLLKLAVKEAIEAEFAYAGIEVTGVSFQDIDPSAKDKQHIESAVDAIRQQQLEKIKTNTEVIRALSVAEAIQKFQQEHPTADLAATYQMMRGLDIQQTAADGSSFVGLILKAFLDKLQAPFLPTPPQTPAAATLAA